MSFYLSLIVSLVILLLSFALFQKASGTMAINKLNMISYIFFFDLFLTSFIGAFLIVNNLDNSDLYKLSNYNVRIYGWIAVLYTMVALPLGMILAVKVFKIRNIKEKLHKYLGAPVVTYTSKKDSYVKYPLYVLTFLLILSTAYVLMNVKNIPLLGVFYGLDPKLLALQRQETSTDFGGVVYIRNLFKLFMAPVLAYITYAYWVITKKNRDLLWFIIVFILTVVLLTYDVQKGPVIKFIIGFLFLNILIKGKVKLQTLILLALTGFTLLILMYLYIMGVPNLEQILLYHNTGLTGRVIIVQIYGLFFYLDIFPKKHDFIGFSSLSGLMATLLGFEYSEPASRIAMQTIYPHLVQANLAGVMNTLFIGEAWANFGIIGLLIAPIYVGFLIESAYLFFIKSPKTPLFLGVFTYFSYNNYLSNGFIPYLYNPWIIFAILFIACFYFLRQKIRKQTKHFLYLKSKYQNKLS